MATKTKKSLDLKQYPCPKCGIVGQCETDGKHIHCLDCGRAFVTPQG